MLAVQEKPSIKKSLYEEDLYAWAQNSVNLLKNKNFAALDIPHLIEEIEDMGRSERRAIESHLRNVLMHLLKWQFQPQMRSKSWELSLFNSRTEISDIILESPSLAYRVEENMALEYQRAVKAASLETGLSTKTFPNASPYLQAQVLDMDWLPE